MSEFVASLDPAIGLLEFDSIAAGVTAADAMVKASPVSALFAGTVHPGRYLTLVGGDTAAVEIALEAGGNDTLVDSLFLADVHPRVIASMVSTDTDTTVEGDALGVVETATAASAIVAADAGAKAADVTVPVLRLADDLGGKAYCFFAGDIADVEAAAEAATERADETGRHVRTSVIPQLHDELRDNLVAELRFHRRLGREAGTG